MQKFSCNKDINYFVKQLIRTGWIFERRKRHGCLASPSGKKISVPCTPSDKRSLINFKRDTDRIMRRVING